MENGLLSNILWQVGSLHKALGKITVRNVFHLKFLADLKRTIHWTVQLKCKVAIELNSKRSSWVCCAWCRKPRETSLWSFGWDQRGSMSSPGADRRNQHAIMQQIHLPNSKVAEAKIREVWRTRMSTGLFSLVDRRGTEGQKRYFYVDRGLWGEVGVLCRGNFPDRIVPVPMMKEDSVFFSYSSRSWVYASWW